MLKKLAHYEAERCYYKCSHLQKDPPDPAAPSCLMTKSLASLKTTPSTWTLDFQGLRICMSQERLSHSHLELEKAGCEEKRRVRSVSQTWGQHNTGGRRSKECCNRPLVRSALYYSNTTLYCFMLPSQSYSMTHNTSSWSNAWYLSVHNATHTEIARPILQVMDKWSKIQSLSILDE